MVGGLSLRANMEDQSWYAAPQQQAQQVPQAPQAPQAQQQQQRQPQPQQAQPTGEQPVPWTLENSGNTWLVDDDTGAGARRGGFPSGPGGSSPGHTMNPAQQAAMAQQQRGAMAGDGDLQRAAQQPSQQPSQGGHYPTPPVAAQGGHPNMPGTAHPQQYTAAPRQIQPAAMSQPQRKPIHDMQDEMVQQHDAQRWAAHTQASMEGVLSCDQAYELLSEDSFQPGHRNSVIRKNSHGLRQPLFKECPKRRLKGEPGADRWRNSGGEKGSSFLRNKQGVQVIRRRYGTVSQSDNSKLKYHEYNLVNQDANGKLSDSKGCTLFHLLPDMKLNDRESQRPSPTGSALRDKRGFTDMTPGGTRRPIKSQRTEGGDDGASLGAGASRGFAQTAGQQGGDWQRQGGDDDGTVRSAGRAGTDNHEWADSQSQVAQVRAIPPLPSSPLLLLPLPSSPPLLLPLPPILSYSTLCGPFAYSYVCLSAPADDEISRASKCRSEQPAARQELSW